MDGEPARRANGSAHERLILPIGRELGTAMDNDDIELVHQVSRGPQVHELTNVEHGIWVLGHGTAQILDSQRVWRREPMTTAAEALGFADAADSIAQLIDKGLFVDLDPDSDAAVEFAKTHRVVPTLLGLGNTADEPTTFGIGLLGQPIVDVDFATYDLWQWSIMDDTLWGACERAADVNDRRSAEGDASHLEPIKLLTDFIYALQVLLYVRAAYLDVAFRIGRPDRGPIA